MHFKKKRNQSGGLRNKGECWVENETGALLHVAEGRGGGERKGLRIAFQGDDERRWKY